MKALICVAVVLWGLHNVRRSWLEWQDHRMPLWGALVVGLSGALVPWE